MGYLPDSSSAPVVGADRDPKGLVRCCVPLLRAAYRCRDAAAA